MDTSTPLWIQNLINEELEAETTGIVHVPSEEDRIQLLDRTSIEKMEDLREQFEFSVNMFNGARAADKPQKAIKLFKIANTVNDFMLYRNSLKLIFARKAVDVITISFFSNQSGFYPTATSYFEPPKEYHHELVASLGPFHQVTWTYQNEAIDVESLSRYLFTEFVRNSMN